MENSSLINPNLVTFLGTIINIGVLFILLRLILFKPVSKFMENRTKKIEDVINQAEKDKNQAKQMLEQYETQLKNAETEADGIIRLARETANAESDRIIDNGKRAAQTMLSGARRQFAAEQEAALAQFKSEAVMLVMAASARLVGRDLQSEENNRYVNMLMDELSAHCAGAAWVKQKED